MKHSLVLALAFALSIAACDRKPGPGPAPVPAKPVAESPSESAAKVAAPSAPESDVAAAPPVAASAARPNAPAVKPGPLKLTAPQLAYDYNYAVQAPPAAVPMLVRMHEDACAAAGATVCQVVGADTRQEGKDDVAGRLEIRAAPEWIKGFRARIEEDVKAAHGTLSSSAVGTEDLSRSIVDTEAALRAKKTLRDRMQNLLATHKGKLDDLVELEQQVANVQGEIDAAQSELEVMKTRVVTAKLVVEYRSTATLAPGSAFGRLDRAVHGFTGHVMDGLAFFVAALSYLLPFGLAFAAALAVHRWNRKRKAPRPE